MAVEITLDQVKEFAKNSDKKKIFLKLILVTKQKL